MSQAQETAHAVRILQNDRMRLMRERQASTEALRVAYAAIEKNLASVRLLETKLARTERELGGIDASIAAMEGRLGYGGSPILPDVGEAPGYLSPRSPPGGFSSLTCPQCGRGFRHPTDLGAHRVRAGH